MTNFQYIIKIMCLIVLIKLYKVNPTNLPDLTDLRSEFGETSVGLSGTKTF